MVKTLQRWLAPAVLCATAMAASAQTSMQTQAPDARPARPDPLDPAAEVPALRYRSSIAPAQGAGAGQPLSWRDANEQVGRIGGWRAYAREAQAVPAPPDGAARNGHTGHGSAKTP